MSRTLCDASMFYTFKTDSDRNSDVDSEEIQTEQRRNRRPDSQTVLATSKFSKEFHYNVLNGRKVNMEEDEGIWGVSTINILLHPKSRGHVHLRSCDP